MSFQVKAVDGNVEEKSQAQVEETLLKKHEEQFEDSADTNVDDGIDRVNFNSQGAQEIKSEKEKEESLPEFSDKTFFHILRKDTTRILILLMNCLRKKRQMMNYQKMCLSI